MGIYACSKCGYPVGWSSVTMTDIPHGCPRPASQAPDFTWPRPLDWSEVDEPTAVHQNSPPEIPDNCATPSAPKDDP